MAEPLRQLTIYDSQAQTKRPFEPQEPGKVRMYVCGVTVYDLTHIGHARVFVFFDVVQRVFKHLGYDINFVRNHTDVDDKIIKRAAEKGVDPLALAGQFIEELDRDMGALGCERPTAEPKVSEHIDEIIAMNQKLLAKDHAYEVDGDVYYRVRSFDDYGKLSHRKLEDMEAGRSGRVEATDKKEHPFDFALWKASKPDQIGWESPWGRGRPGWHIECSVMSTHYLGDSLDIHGGGRDLIFPHHENEIAQSEAATGTKPFAKYWMHVGMVNVAEQTEEGESVVRKMSKSLGNFWTTRDVLKGYHPEAIRYFMHTTLYRNPITYAVENLEEATRRMTYLYTALEQAEQMLAKVNGGEKPEGKKLVGGTAELVDGFMDRFDEALADDFNTPRALALIGELAKAINEVSQAGDEPTSVVAWGLYKMHQLLVEAGGVLGILGRDPATALAELRDRRLQAMELDAADIDEKVAARDQARADKDWERADALRDELAELGVEIMDSPDGTTWRFK